MAGCEFSEALQVARGRVGVVGCCTFLLYGRSALRYWPAVSRLDLAPDSLGLRQRFALNELLDQAHEHVPSSVELR